MADFQTLQVPFVKGLDTRTHPHLLDPPGLTTCKNAQFDQVGLSFRYPYDAIGASVYPSGTLSNVRKLAVVGDELLAFTDGALYSWSATLSKWLSRGEHLAVSTTETPVFGNTNDQVFTDRAQLSGVIVTVTTEVAAGSTLCYLQARDATTGATLIAPTSFGAALTRPRVVALATKILVTWMSGVSLFAKAIDPAAPTFTTAGGTSLTLLIPVAYDIVKDPAADQAVFVACDAAAISYEVGKVTAALAVTTSTKARISDGALALSCSPAAANRVQILRVDNTTGATDRVMGDLLAVTTLADVITEQAIGIVTALTVNQLTGAHRSTADGGFYRCYAFWSVAESSASDDLAASGTSYNYVDTNGTIGTEAVLVYRNGLASRAFDYNGRVFVWTVFAASNNAEPLVAGDTILGFEVPVQSSYYLHRDDGEFFAKAAWSRAGGYGYYTGHLPGVALVSGTTVYGWATTDRSFTDLGGYFNSAGYGDRGPRDVVFTFDSDLARRVVQLGATAYVTGGLILQYDGEGLTEVGFEQFPWYLSIADVAAGSMAAGVYSYKGSLRAVNARGESERSTTAIGRQLAVAVNREVGWWMSRLRVTRKTGSRRPPALELWRTVTNPPVDAPFYLTTSRDPSATGDNGYVANSTTAVLAARDQIDSFTDAILTTKEQHPENGAVLPRFAPPPATIMAATDTRLILAGVAGDPLGIWYSLQRNEGEVAGFHPALRVALPAATGPVTALAILDKTIVAWTATATYVLTGDGFDNTAGGSNYDPRLVPNGLGTGCTSQDTVAVTPVGSFFFGRRGWYRLTSGWDLEYIGAPVEDYNGDSWVAAHAVDVQHQVRVLSSTRMLMFDWLAGQWSEWTETNGRSLAMWRGNAMMADTNVKQQAATLAGITYDLDVETGWFKPSGPQGRNRVRFIEILGELKVAHTRRVRVGVNYVASAYTDDRSIALTGTAGDAAQTRMGPRVQQVQSMRVRVTVSSAGDNVVLTGLALEVAPQKGVRRLNPTNNQ